MKKKALQLASVASMIDLFNMDNIHILQDLGYKVDVACNFEEGSITSKERVEQLKKELNDDGIDTYHIPIPRSPRKIREIVDSYKMIKKLADNDYQIIHCHSPIGGVLCRLACRKARNKYGTKVIYTAHGFHFFKGAKWYAWMFFYPIEKFCSRYTDLLITINKEDYQNAKKMKAKHVEYVPGVGVNTEDIRNCVVDRDAVRSEFGFEKDDFVFLSVGQLSVRKNQELVIRALSLINNERVKYLIVGFGEREKYLKQLAEQLKLDNRVVFAGYRGNVKEILRSVDAFAFPSLQEGLPVALMEAMAAGVPSVCSNIRGNNDLIINGKNGFLAGLNAEEYKDKMLTLFNQPELCKILSNEMKESIKKYDAENVKSIMTNCYLLAQNS